MRQVQVGEIVLYRITTGDVEQLRAHPRPGAFVHAYDDTLPLLVVRIEPDAGRLRSLVSGQVFLEGEGTLWVSARHEGTEPGTWQRRPESTEGEGT